MSLLNNNDNVNDLIVNKVIENLVNADSDAKEMIQFLKNFRSCIKKCFNKDNEKFKGVCESFKLFTDDTDKTYSCTYCHRYVMLYIQI